MQWLVEWLVVQCAIKWRQPSIGAVLALTSNHTLPQLVLLLSSSHFQLLKSHCEGKSKRFHTICILYFFSAKGSIWRFDVLSQLLQESKFVSLSLYLYLWHFVFLLQDGRPIREFGANYCKKAGLANLASALIDNHHRFWKIEDRFSNLGKDFDEDENWSCGGWKGKQKHL